VIAAESLFLKESGQGEPGFRLSTRAASFVDGGSEERRRVLNFLRKAHEARSGIVHNGLLNEAKLLNLNGKRASAAEFTDELENLMRLALKKAILFVSAGKSFPLVWDKLLFPLSVGRSRPSRRWSAYSVRSPL
jgi:hypothetical protein